MWAGNSGLWPCSFSFFFVVGRAVFYAQARRFVDGRVSEMASYGLKPVVHCRHFKGASVLVVGSVFLSERAAIFPPKKSSPTLDFLLTITLTFASHIRAGGVFLFI